MNRLTLNGFRLTLAALTLIVVGGCAGLDLARIPPLDTSSTQPIEGKVVWHDLLTTDPKAAKYFYSKLFGWEFRDQDLGRGLNYTLIEHEGRVIGGLVDARGIKAAANVSRWIPVLSISEMDAAIAAVRAGGGDVLQPPINIPQRGTVAVIADPLGAILTLLEPLNGDPVDRVAKPGDWLWNEIWSSDPQATMAFYQSLVPEYSVEHVGETDGYYYFRSSGAPRVGVMQKPVDRMVDTWMGYVRVSNPAETGSDAKQLGGEVLMPARENPRGGEVAILNDPSGAGFLVQKWNADSEAADEQ